MGLPRSFDEEATVDEEATERWELCAEYYVSDLSLTGPCGVMMRVTRSLVRKLTFDLLLS